MEAPWNQEGSPFTLSPLPAEQEGCPLAQSVTAEPEAGDSRLTLGDRGSPLAAGTGIS